MNHRIKTALTVRLKKYVEPRCKEQVRIELAFEHVDLSQPRACPKEREEARSSACACTLLSFVYAHPSLRLHPSQRFSPYLTIRGSPPPQPQEANLWVPHVDASLFVFCFLLPTLRRSAFLRNGRDSPRTWRRADFPSSYWSLGLCCLGFEGFPLGVVFGAPKPRMVEYVELCIYWLGRGTPLY